MSIRTARPASHLVLDGRWEFAWLGEHVDLSPLDHATDGPGPTRWLTGVTFDRTAVVPGSFDTMPDLAGVRGTAAYRTRIPAFSPGEGARPAGAVHFDGLGIWAAVFVDGELRHVHRKPYSPFTVSLPNGTMREHELVVVVDNRFDTSRSPLQENYFDFYAYGGIFRPVTVLSLPAVHVTEVRVTTVSLEPPAVEVETTLGTSGTEAAPGAAGAAPQTDAPTAPITIRYLVDGTEIAREERPLPAFGDGRARAAGAGAAPLRLELQGRELWSPQSPVLHTLTVVVDAHAQASPQDSVPAGTTEDATSSRGLGAIEEVGIRDEYTVRFGIRTVTTEGNRLLLNGSPVSLFGWNRHESHAQYGPALPEQQLLHDLEIMMRAGANFVRGSHYPQDERFLDLCDEHGVLVWEESIGWQQNESHFANEEYQALVNEQQAEMIAAHYNRPSIVMWGFQNELRSDLPESRPVIERLAATTRESDPSRPVTFASCRFPNDLCLDLVDIVSLNIYPGWYAADPEEYRPLDEIASRLDAIRDGLAGQGLADKPLIISEIGAGAIYGWRDPHAGHWSEQYQSDYLAEICSQFLDRDDIMGLALWQFCDCRTYGSGRALTRPRGFNNKGVVDEYRRPKQAYEIVRALMTER